MFCQNCNLENQDEVKFCTNCRTRLGITVLSAEAQSRNQQDFYDNMLAEQVLDGPAEIGLWVGEKILGGTLTKATGSLVDLCISEIAPLVGYTPDFEKFKSELMGKLDQMAGQLSVINDKLDYLTKAVFAVQRQIETVMTELKNIEANIVYQTVQSELAVRMTIVNTYISKIEHTYSLSGKLNKVLGENKLLLDKKKSGCKTPV